jgi:tRNA dimethylallyltransferase
MNKLLVILGPTASGKSDLAIKIARSFSGEIISADSRQVYKEMNIGTAKPMKDNLHNLLDLINPDKHFSASQYKKLAYKTIKNIQKKDKLPILCGGTGLYISSVIENWQFPTIPPQEKLRKQLAKKTIEQLFIIYERLDPKGANFIDKKNKRRLIRAIEVCRTNNKPFWQQRKKNEPLFNTLIIGINLSKEELKKRISARIKKMIKTGLETEIKTLVKKYGWIPSLQTIGYQEWQQYFDNKINKKEVQDLIELHTLQYSKRQMTWFKKMENVQWIEKPEQAIKLTKLFLK